jgi:predicted  nucleic acid-binding Zn-ribbon protein
MSTSAENIATMRHEIAALCADLARAQHREQIANAALTRAVAEIARYKGAVEAARVYMLMIDRHYGDDWIDTDRRRARMALENALDAAKGGG